jgi:hypothetical protein
LIYFEFIMRTIAIQYLEGQGNISVKKAREKLKAAFDILPIAKVLLGWNLPESLVDICAEVCERNGALLYRWQPLLTGDGEFCPEPEWTTISFNNEPVTGFQDQPEFTFTCPNRPEVKEAVSDNIVKFINNSPYQGLFLDRIRFPSPMADPEQHLACFCKDCEKKAALQGLDFELVRKSIGALPSNTDGIRQFINLLFNPEYPVQEESREVQAVHAFFSFRKKSVTDFVTEITQEINNKGLSVGLDCFSLSLTHAVGQDLDSLAACSDWIKIMSYAHTFGVAGLPYEFVHVIQWLMKKGFTEPEAIRLMEEATQLPFPETINQIREKGFSPEVLALETKRAQKDGVTYCLPGIELVDQEDLTNLNIKQITADIKAFQDAGAQGLVLSWDLWFIPLERLELVKKAWKL